MINFEEQFFNPSLNKTLQLIPNILNDFERVSSFHILRELNNHADVLVNKHANFLLEILVSMENQVHFSCSLESISEISPSNWKVPQA